MEILTVIKIQSLPQEENARSRSVMAGMKLDSRSVVSSVGCGPQVHFYLRFFLLFLLSDVP